MTWRNKIGLLSYNNKINYFKSKINKLDSLVKKVLRKLIEMVIVYVHIVRHSQKRDKS